MKHFLFAAALMAPLAAIAEPATLQCSIDYFANPDEHDHKRVVGVHVPVNVSTGSQQAAKTTATVTDDNFHVEAIYASNERIGAPGSAKLGEYDRLTVFVTVKEKKWTFMLPTQLRRKQEMPTLGVNLTATGPFGKITVLDKDKLDPITYEAKNVEINCGTNRFPAEE